jgi:hypothetical protein
MVYWETNVHLQFFLPIAINGEDRLDSGSGRFTPMNELEE